MNDAEKRLAQSLERLLNATAGLERPGATLSNSTEFCTAREQAAKLMLQHRAKRGEPMLALPDLTSFWDRWRRMRHVTLPRRREGRQW